MNVKRYKLLAGEETCLHGTCSEVFVHPLVGRGEIDGTPIGGRKNIFHAFPGGLLTTDPFIVSAKTDFDFIVASHPTKHPMSGPELIGYKKHQIGDGTLRREVREVLGCGGKARHLRCGETINAPGGWSSWPPHSFDRDGADDFQEVFYVFTDTKDGYAIIRKNGVLEELHSGERTDVPLGEHPIVAGPGVRLMYIWFYVGADKQYAKWAEDLGGYK